jgi:hypothetical protein
MIEFWRPVVDLQLDRGDQGEQLPNSCMRVSLTGAEPKGSLLSVRERALRANRRPAGAGTRSMRLVGLWSGCRLRETLEQPPVPAGEILMVGGGGDLGQAGQHRHAPAAGVCA